MSSFSAVESRQPPSNVVVPPSAFASNWEDRPLENVCMGLRFVPDSELEDARIEAYRRAKGLFSDYEKTEAAAALFIASFQDALVRWIVARGTCDPNDAQKSWQLWAAAPEDIVRDALTDQGAQLIFDAWERMRIAANIGVREATDDELHNLPRLLARLPSITSESRTRAIRVRRLLRFVIEELEAFEEPETEPTNDASTPPT